MQSRWLSQRMTYDGTQLRSLFTYMTEGIMGDSILSWRGPCAIAWEHMVDGEDLRAKSPIAGADMLHFIVEKFECQMFGAVTFQRLMSSIAADLIRELSPNRELAVGLTRKGDDLFFAQKKLSISVATLGGGRSALIHFAMNVTNEGTPVETLSLGDLEIDPKTFAHQFMEKVTEEEKSITEATYKVRSVY